MSEPLTDKQLRQKLYDDLVLLWGGAWPMATDWKPEARLREDVGLDSLDHVEMVMLLEDEFGVNITDEEAQKLETVQQVVDLLRALGVK